MEFPPVTRVSGHAQVVIVVNPLQSSGTAEETALELPFHPE
jgi:hypothetical protein